jgi:hypothetical protein
MPRVARANARGVIDDGCERSRGGSQAGPCPTLGAQGCGGGERFNPYDLVSPGISLFGSPRELYQPWIPSPEVARAAVSLMPGVNSLLVLSDPNATGWQKGFAVATDVLSVVGVGVFLKMAGVGVRGAVALGEVGSARGVPKLLSAFTQTTHDAVLASSQLAKGATTRGASLLEKRVAEGVITGVKPTQANAERIIADVLGKPLRTQATSRFGQIDVVGQSFGQEVSIRINTQTGKVIGFRRVDF